MLSFLKDIALRVKIRRSKDHDHSLKASQSWYSFKPQFIYLSQIDPAYLLQATTKESDAGQLFTLHNAVAISGIPLEDEDDEARQKVALLREKLEWLKSLEGR